MDIYFMMALLQMIFMNLLILMMIEYLMIMVEYL